MASDAIRPSKKHVFPCGKRPDAGGAKRHGGCGLFGIVGVGPHFHAGGLTTPFQSAAQSFLKVLPVFRLGVVCAAIPESLRSAAVFTWAGVDDAARSVDAEEVASFAKGLAADGQCFGVIIDRQCGGAADTRLCPF